jgi:hypothetical protein
MASISRAETHPSNTKTMPNKAIETFRVVMPRNPLEELLRIESMRKSRSKGNIFKKGEKSFEKIPSSERI